MRSEQDIMELILNFARSDERIRVVGMEGSRTNKNILKDEFQDYDISFIATEMDSFLKDDQWLDYFGTRIFIQKPEAMSLFSPELGNWFSYLMLFEDGVRIDLTLIPLDELGKYLSSDKLLKILLDKDERITNPPIPTDEDYWVKKPTVAFFDDCCNEFWWVTTYVAKGLCRKEILYATHHLNDIVRPNLLLMLSWKIGYETNYSLSLGKNYKFLQQYVSNEMWKRLLKTYQNDSYEAVWKSLFLCMELFREVSKAVSEKFNYPYPNYDHNITLYIMNLYQKYRN